jgi:hypothetical protein
VNTLEERLRAATRAAARTVAADSAPPLRLPARPMHHRVPPRWHGWRRWLAPAAAAASVIAVVAGLVAIGGRTHGPRVPGHAGAVAFPGGGRILFADAAQGLKWLYPNGKTTEIAAGFIGASLAEAGTRLLAWRPTQNPRAVPPCGGCFADVDYYLMNLNGSERRLVLRAEATTKRGNRVGHLAVKISPYGTKLAYVRQVESGVGGNVLSDRLWVADLATGRKVDLGAAPSSDLAVAWMDNSTLLAESPTGNILQRVSIAGRGRTTYLTVSNSRIVQAYQRARPGAGPPVDIEPVGWSTDSNRSALAVLLWGSQRHDARAVVALIEGRRVIGFAPDSRPQLALTWGPNGLFLLESCVGDRPDYGSGLYAGIVGRSALFRVPHRLSRLAHSGVPNEVAFNPGGSMIAQGYEDGSWRIAAVPRAICSQEARCATSRPVTLNEGGTLLAWASTG